MRLNAALALTALALPAQAQRLDTRVRDVGTGPLGTTCVLNANSGMIVDHNADGTKVAALLFQPPDTRDPDLDVRLAIPFARQPGKRFGAAGSAIGVQLNAPQGAFPIDLRAGRLLIDGQDSGVKLMVQKNPDLPTALYLTIPNADRESATDRMLAGRVIEFQAIDRKGAVVRTFRFDALRINDAVETVSIIKWSCNGAKAG